jgi:Cu/Ag efflux pump CusA
MLASLPLSVAGGVLAAPLAGGAWSTGSLAGVFAVFALALRSSVLLGRQIDAAEQAAGGADSGAVLAAARDRAAPLLQSALVTAAVLLPAAVLGSRAGLEFLHPLAVTVLGGLVSMIIAQLFLLPALLMTTARRRPEPQPETRPLAEAASE